ncbi:hypothetical protein GP486_005365 [Trichoglossum hirsutum]|uniref:Uncharacterized protein n=1 Tax=Trichoglossum hirsutum TaxID=265104 RepID=A0A9P8L9E1_9PEZI|nr:hypothetical protein GP486_005365 [Trichoglossum hirsutum]
MAMSEDLINFDIIEEQKENIQSLPGGRSARYLASMLSPSPSLRKGTLSPTLSETQNLHDTIRREYEAELLTISESDDPLDIYDRYIKWTLYAYPSAQATPQSQLLPLLERATKAFLTSSHYKNDPRYLKMWLHYINFFSDSPRETFAFLARHSVGDGLALYYEEFAAWFESAGRWVQANEIYELGIQREARPTERLARRYAQFQERYNQRPQSDREPSSPALPTVRPALAAKVDPFTVSTPGPVDPQARPPSAGIGSGSTRRPHQKLAVFSDPDTREPAIKMGGSEESKAWENIGSLAHRKKENVMEARPWVGETLKAGRKIGGGPKMAVFKDLSSAQAPIQEKEVPLNAKSELYQQEQINPRTGKAERVFVNLEACYPNPEDPSTELSFEELRAIRRGWIGNIQAGGVKAFETCGQESTRDGKGVGASIADGSIGVGTVPKTREAIPEPSRIVVSPTEAIISEGQEIMAASEKQELSGSQTLGTTFHDEDAQLEDERYGVQDGNRGMHHGRPRRLKLKEVKGETQIVKINLESPTGPKLRRKVSTEPTMTFHTRAATDEIYNIFNQPLADAGVRNEDPGEDTGDDDYDDCTSGGESTGTGLIESRGTSRAASEIGDDDEAKSASEWSDFTALKHTSILNGDREDTDVSEHELEGLGILTDDVAAVSISEKLVTPTSPKPESPQVRTKFVPIPPEDYEPPPVRPNREHSKSSQNRLPFMTPIVERTESSLGMSTRNDTRNERRSFAAAKTPSRSNGPCHSTLPGISSEDDLMSSPFQETVDDMAIGPSKVSQPPLLKLADAKTSAALVKGQTSARGMAAGKDTAPKGPIVKDAQCNPTDGHIRNLIFENLQPPISSYDGFFNRRDQTSGRSTEIRKFARIAEKKCGDKTTTSIVMPPILRFEGADREYMMKKEIGKGAFAPVYLVENTSAGDDAEDGGEPAVMGKGKFGLERKKLEAVKMEDPPTPWEFYIMRQAKRRLGVSRAADSIIHAYEMHLFADEGFLVEEYRDQGTLLDLVNIAKADNSGSGVMDESLAMFFTIELFRTAEALHAKGILHGDLKADNCLVRFDPVAESEWSIKYRRDGTAGWHKKGLALIDFGRGIDMKLFAPTVQFIADWKTGAQDCAEMREMRPWTYQIDYHGLAGIVHSMLFGKYIDTVADRGSKIGGGATKTYRIQSPLKRYWQQEIWNVVFDVLLNPLQHVENEEKGILPIVKSMRLVREQMEEWLEGNCEKGMGLKNVIRRTEIAIRERFRPGGR